ncbi:unnamed protein product [Rotaria socialis]|uniref:Major facilitator superfamily (MFS) profile domain-containing protein n=1 Tax=Rotaria socialis TaxID=392032 RepID=A0A817XHB3_9BILA|nr:unnamed protein product [Rotaria socialis]CAF4548462.1 unnamed protein product [Rotaria socialis]
MQFDDFYEIVGVFGRYQKVKYLMICLAYMLPPIMVYTWVFTAATPSFRCRILVEEMSDVEIPKNILSRYIPSESQCRQYKSQISISECQRCYQNTNRSIFNEGIKTPLKSCNSFVFDRTYYQSTLVEEWSMVCNQVSLKSFVQTIFFFGYMIGSLVFGVLSDRYGRRPIMGISFCIISVASFICAIAPQENLGFQWSYALFILGRFLLACASRGVALTGFVIGVEIVGPKQRLFTGIVVQYFFAIGQLLLLVFAFVIRTWRLLHMALAILSVPFLFFYFLLSESPRWLISKGYYDEAEKILRQIAKTNNNNFDSIAYQRLVTEEKKKEAAVAVKGHGLKHLLKSKVMCIISINMSIQWFVQNLVYYGVSQSTGAWLVNPYISFGAGAVIEIFAYFIAHCVLKRWSRKKAYSSFVIGFATFAFLVVPIQMLMIKGSSSQHALMFIAHITMKFFATGSYAIIYIYANELFPTNARNTGIGICSMIARTGAIVGTLSNDHLSRVWLHFPVVVFGFTSILAVALIAICPETFNKPLPQTIEDVEEMGLSFLCTNSKPLPCPHVEDNDDMDENKLLNKQSKNNVV